MEANVVIELEHPGHVRRAIVVKCLPKTLGRAYNIPEVDEENLALSAEFLDQRFNVIAH